MAERIRTGQVQVNGQVAGYLYELREGQREYYQFEYLLEYTENGGPIGHAFPLTEQAYRFDVLPPFFENLISEGWIRTHQATRARLDKQDSFGLLLANGQDLIGALSVIPVEIN